MTTAGKRFRKQPADLTGRKFNLLTALRLLGKGKNDKWMWQCRCDCGRLATVSASHLIGDNTRSCGCLRWSAARKRKQQLKRPGPSHSGVICPPTYRHQLARDAMREPEASMGEAKLSVYRQFHKRAGT